MQTTIEIWMPAPPEFVGFFLGIVALYIGYAAVKFVVSLWTGA